jgi:hypothetical protein
MDTLLMVVGASSIIIIGLMIFFLVKLFNNIKLLNDNNEKALLLAIDATEKNMQEYFKSIREQQFLNQEILEKSISNINVIINDKSDKLNRFVNETMEKLNLNNDKTKSLIIDELKSQNNKLISILDDVKMDHKSLEKNVSESTSDIIVSMKNELDLLDKKMVTTFKVLKDETNNIKNISEKYGLNIKNQLENSFQNTVKLVNHLRLDNLINVSNEISKYKQGIYEDEHFLQEIGYCKIIRLTDKKSGDVTNVNYDENGEKLFTETYNGDVKKYSMQYENNKLKIGKEFDSNGVISFEYFYDDMEEITKKIEYIYNSNFELQNKNEISC